MDMSEHDNINKPQELDLPDTIDNKRRGCGFLEEDAAYLRTDSSAFGILPPFVEFSTPIKYLEEHSRTWKKFPGIQFEKAVTQDMTETLPRNEIERHLNRIEENGSTGRHVGEMMEAQSFDLIMHVGASHYPTPEDFIKECKHQGLNKRIPKNNIPDVYPGKTRLFVIHPNAVPPSNLEDILEEEDLDNPTNEFRNKYYKPGIIGYSYITRAVYTKPSQGDIPQFIQEEIDTGRLDPVEAGEEVERADGEMENQSLKGYGDNK